MFFGSFGSGGGVSSAAPTHNDRFDIASPGFTVTLSYTPSSTTGLLVFRNGLRLTGTTDYTVAGDVITFVAQLQVGDVVGVVYWE